MTSLPGTNTIEQAVAEALCGVFFDSGEALTYDSRGVLKQGTRENYVYAYSTRWKEYAAAAIKAMEQEQ